MGGFGIKLSRKVLENSGTTGLPTTQSLVMAQPIGCTKTYESIKT